LRRGLIPLWLRLLPLWLVIAACGGAQSPSPTPAATAEIASRFPVLARVPAGCTFFLSVARLDRGLVFLGNLLAPVWPAGAPMRGVFGGMSPFSPGDMADVGFAVDRSAVIYTEGLLPTLILPIADEARLTRFIEGLFKDATVLVADVRGVHLTTWKPGMGVELTWGVLHSPDGPWLVAHVHVEAVQPFPMRWLDEILDATGGVAASEDAAWAVSRTGGETGGQVGGKKDALGLLRYPQLAVALDEIHLEATPGAKRIALAMTLGERGAQAVGFVELEPVLVEKIGAASHDPPAAMIALRDAAGLYLGVDGEALAHAPPFTPLVDVSRWKGLRLALAGDLEGALWGRVQDRARAAEQLDATLPLHGHERRGARDVNQSSLATLPVEWSLENDEVIVGLGAGLHDRVAGSAPRADHELFGFRLQRDRVGDLGRLADPLAAAGLIEAGFLERLRETYRRLGAALTLVPGGIRMEGGFELR
jgi:hypothetical protein